MHACCVKFFTTFEIEKSVLLCVFASHFLMISGSGFGCLGLENQAFGVRRVAKNNFSHMLGFCCFRCHSYMFGFGIDFDDFWCLGDRLEIL